MKPPKKEGVAAEKPGASMKIGPVEFRPDQFGTSVLELNHSFNMIISHDRRGDSLSGTSGPVCVELLFPVPVKRV